MTSGPDTDSTPPTGEHAVSAHADYRHEDYFFARSQSRALEALEWQHGDETPSRGPGLIAAVILVVVCGLGVMAWEESQVYANTGINDTHRPLVERSGNFK